MCFAPKQPQVLGAKHVWNPEWIFRRFYPHSVFFMLDLSLQPATKAPVPPVVTSFRNLALTVDTAYYLKVEGRGYEAVATQVVQLPRGTYYQSDATVVVSVALQAAPSSSTFRYAWSMDTSRAGAAATVNVVPPPVVKFLGGDVALSDDQAVRIYIVYSSQGCVDCNRGRV